MPWLKLTWFTTVALLTIVLLYTLVMF